MPVPPTEERNRRTLDLDTLPTLGLLNRLNDEDALVVPAVRRALPALATVVDTLNLPESTMTTSPLLFSRSGFTSLR